MPRRLEDGSSCLIYKEDKGLELMQLLYILQKVPQSHMSVLFLILSVYYFPLSNLVVKSRAHQKACTEGNWMLGKSGHTINSLMSPL